MIEDSLRRLADPDWRHHMPLRWRLSRWWSCWWPVVACYAALWTVLAIAAVVLWSAS